MEETRSWSDLPQYLLELILKHLTIPHRLLFGSVSRSWCIAQRQCPLLPFIVFFGYAGSKRDIVEIYSLLDKRIYKMPVQELVCRSCISSSHGWMLLQANNKSYALLVKNKERVPLPWAFRDHYIDFLFISTPSDPDGLIFVRKSNNTFLLYRCCSNSSMSINGRELSCLIPSSLKESCMYTLSLEQVKKRKLHALNDENWNLEALDPLFPETNTTMKMKLKMGNNTQLQQKLECQVFVLVESNGEMLMVRMMGNRVRDLRCDVFRANLTKLEWMKVENLGDRMLFLSQGSSISVCASETGCKGNRIYFIPSLFKKCKGVSFESPMHDVPYVDIELGLDGMTIHSIPVQSQFEYLVGCSWFTPCLS